DPAITCRGGRGAAGRTTDCRAGCRRVGALPEDADRRVHRLRCAGTVRRPVRHAVSVLARMAGDRECRLRISGVVGASLVYNDATFAGVGALDLFRIDSTALLDLRAGVEIDSGRYRLWAWGKNVT